MCMNTPAHNAHINIYLESYLTNNEFIYLSLYFGLDILSGLLIFYLYINAKMDLTKKSVEHILFFYL